MANGAERFRPAEHVDVEEFGAEVVILHLRTGEVHHLDRVSTLVWRALARSDDTVGIAADVRPQLTDAPRDDELCAALLTHLQHLVTLGLVDCYHDER